MEKMHPVLRWVGGKWKNIKQFARFLPRDFDRYYYIEPFVGSAAMLIYKRPERAFISDMNPDIYNLYKTIYKAPVQLVKLLEKHDLSDNEEYYYKVREEFNETSKLQVYTYTGISDMDIEQSGRFLYLNARCFNGLYRENSDGEMNSPYAKDLKGMKKIANKENIDALHEYFFKNQVRLDWGDYEISLSRAKIESSGSGKHAFFFLDPPYYPLTETASFTSYTGGPWSDSDFVRLRIFVDKITEHGWKFLLCNHSVPFIKSLFKGYYQVEHLVSRSVSQDAKNRKPVMELLVANYPIKQSRQLMVI